jgi:hypothetical protein
MELLPIRTLNTNITFVELFQALKKLQKNKVVGLDGMKAKVHFGCRRITTHAITDNIQLLFSEGFSRSPFHWGGPHAF